MAFDGLKKLLGKGKEAGQELLKSPQMSEEDMYDPNQLPNQKMAGQGLLNVLGAFSKLTPNEEDIPTVLSKENAAQYGVNLPQDIKFDPTAVAAGSVKTMAKMDPDMQRAITGQLKNYMEQNAEGKLSKINNLLFGEKPTESIAKMYGNNVAEAARRYAANPNPETKVGLMKTMEGLADKDKLHVLGRVHEELIPKVGKPPVIDRNTVSREPAPIDVDLAKEAPKVQPDEDLIKMIDLPKLQEEWYKKNKK